MAHAYSDPASTEKVGLDDRLADRIQNLEQFIRDTGLTPLT